MSLDQHNPDPDSLPNAYLELGGVVREQLLQTLSTEIGQLAGRGRSRAKIINYYGISGSGKTFLLDQIYERFGSKYALYWLDFDLNDQQTTDWGTVIEQLSTIPALAFLPDTIELTVAEPIPAQQLAVVMRSNAVAAQPKKPLLLLIDHLDDLPYWRWLQEQIIKPLVAQQPCLVVCTSQSPLFWHFWELQELVTTLELPPFSLDDTRRYLRRFELELLTPSAQAMTGGYPLRLAHLVDFLMTQRATLEQLRISEHDLDKLSLPTRAALLHTGLLRRVEAPVMLELLQTFAPDWSGLQPAHTVLLTQVLPELISNNYFEGYVRGQPYCFQPALRQMIEHMLQAVSDDHLLRVCLQLEEIYAKRFEQQPITEITALNEWCYFSCLVRARGIETAEHNDWDQRLHKLLRRGRIVGMRLVVSLYKDDELLHLLRQTDRFSSLQRELYAIFDLDSLSASEYSAAPFILNETELGKHQRAIIKTLSRQRPIRELDQIVEGGLESIFPAIADIGTAFNPQMLCMRLQASLVPVTIEITRQIVSLLLSYGILEYNRDQRMYRLTPSVMRPSPHTRADSSAA